MALRSSFRLLSSAGTKSVPPPGVASSIRERLATGKLLRPDVADDILRKPVDEAKYRSPAPGSQPQPSIPQGSYDKVYDITYHSRDSRRHIVREVIDPAIVAMGELPPTPGNPTTSTYLGLAGDWDVRK